MNNNLRYNTTNSIDHQLDDTELVSIYLSFADLSVLPKYWLETTETPYF